MCIRDRRRALISTVVAAVADLAAGVRRSRLCHRGDVLDRKRIHPRTGRGSTLLPTSSHLTCGSAGKRPTMNTLDSLDAGSLRDDIPDFRAGDTINCLLYTSDAADDL